MTEKEINTFVKYCRDNFNLGEIAAQRNYGSLPLCILDAVFCSTGHGYTAVINVTQRYANNFLNGDRFATGLTLSNFIREYDRINNPQIFTNNYLGNQWVRGGHLLIELCYTLARNLQDLGIETIEDFQDYKRNNEENLRTTITNLYGFGDNTVTYLFMLCGDADVVIPNVHINDCTHNVLGRNLSDEETQELFTRTVDILRMEYAGLTVASLDHAIWLDAGNNN